MEKLLLVVGPYEMEVVVGVFPYIKEVTVAITLYGKSVQNPYKNYDDDRNYLGSSRREFDGEIPTCIKNVYKFLMSYCSVVLHYMKPSVEEKIVNYLSSVSDVDCWHIVDKLINRLKSK